MKRYKRLFENRIRKSIEYIAYQISPIYPDKILTYWTEIKSVQKEGNRLLIKGTAYSFNRSYLKPKQGRINSWTKEVYEKHPLDIQENTFIKKSGKVNLQINEIIESINIKRYESLFEEVYGNNAFVYHRTSDIKNIKLLLKKGIRTGEQGKYGTGLYSTYTLESQLNPRMENSYGQVIIRFKINLQGYLILDLIEAKKVYGNNYKLQDQIKILKLNIQDSDSIDPNSGGIITRIKDFDESPPKITSRMAEILASTPKIKTKIKGLLFTGGTDGRVCVTYDLASLIPVSYVITNFGINPYMGAKISEPKIINKNYDPAEWQSIDFSGKLPDTRTQYPSKMYSQNSYYESDTLEEMLSNNKYNNTYETILSPKKPIKKRGYYIIEWNMDRVSKAIDLFKRGQYALINNDQYTEIENFSYLINEIDLCLPQKLGEEGDRIAIKDMEDMKKYLAHSLNADYSFFDDEEDTPIESTKEYKEAEILIKKFRLKP